MNFLAYLLPGTTALLEAILALLLLRGPFRRYPLLLVYCCTVLARFGAEGFALSSGGVQSPLYRNVYWTGELVDQSLLFLLVITLTYRAMEGNPLRAGMGKMLGLIAVVAVLLPFVLYHPYFTGRWFRHTSQLISLGAAFMNLLLWTAIIGKKGRDPQLLMVSAGVGVAVTGLAITYGLLQFMSSETVRWLPDVFKGLTQVAGNAIWCWAFRPGFAPRQRDNPPGHVAVGRV